MTPQQMLHRYAQALDARRPLEALWQGCYDMALPRPGSGVQIFDATAADAAEQLAASLLAELTPPWSRWFGLAPGRGAAEDPATLGALEDAAATLQRHFDRSNFGIEVHQAFLDLVVAGTGVLLVEEAPLGEASAFRFAAVPLRNAVLGEGPSGRLDTVFRQARLTPAQLRQRHPAAELPMAIEQAAEENGQGLGPRPCRRTRWRCIAWWRRCGPTTRAFATWRCWPMSRTGRWCWPRAASARTRSSPSVG